MCKQKNVWRYDERNYAIYSLKNRVEIRGIEVEINV